MSNTTAVNIVDQMFDNDLFSQWLGIERLVVEQGKSVLRIKIREEMVNGFGIVHGGVTYSLADSALAFASNAHGKLSVALECSISYSVSVKVNDVITASAEEFALTNKTGVYLITLTNQHNEKVAFFKGTVYRTSKEWLKENLLL